VIVDLTPSLVEVAKKRVKENGWEGKVQVIEVRHSSPAVFPLLCHF
jgi:tRNA1(Val) A37 N6-methylase TrmN6